MRDTHTERLRHRQREKQAPCREHNAGLDPGSPGSRPGLKAKPLSHSGCPRRDFFNDNHRNQLWPAGSRVGGRGKT